MEQKYNLEKIISGGQTGVDRAALDEAKKKNLKRGGYCPKGKVAEDGTIPDEYGFLVETDSVEYEFRTRKNIDISDGTLVILPIKNYGIGTKLTIDYARSQNKPIFIITAEDYNKNTNQEFYKWIINNNISSLNIGGPRQSEGFALGVDIYNKAKFILEELFEHIKKNSPNNSPGIRYHNDLSNPGFYLNI